MDDKTKKKTDFLESWGFKFHEEVWISEAGELSHEFVDDHSLTEIRSKLTKAMKASELRKEPFKLYNG
jgi:hypothetical protein